ncbi:hypothetical protein K439DRAFT_1661009 [Ramaria rubella]|nr:hypothetical protein K439DRAFT_1661009 [Ramaria rubella]
MTIDPLRLNCWVIGDDIRSVFDVEISPSKSVSALRKAIKIEQEPRFNDIPAVEFDLWKVSLPGNDFLDTANKTVFESECLNPLSKLSEVFAEGLVEGNLHVIVKRRHDFVSDQLLDLPQLRKHYLDRFPQKPPSDLAKPSQIRTLQTNNDTDGFQCNRPSTKAPVIPITLLHSVFNQFLHNCEHISPSYKDHAFALELAGAMSGFFKSESLRQDSFIEVCRKHGIQLIPEKIPGTDYKTDAAIRCNDNLVVIGELKNEVCTGGAEPIFQAACYYTADLRNNEAALNSGSPIPCLGFYLVGPMLGFVGFAFTDRPQIQTLGMALRLDYHSTDVKARRAMAQHLAAFRKAIECLREYYETSFPNQECPRSNPRFPYYSSYTSLADDKKYDIIYTAQPIPDKLIFFGKIEGAEVCVKFTKRYSREAHLKCAALGFAPTLRGFETLLPDWYMVVMDRIDETHSTLDQARTAGLDLDSHLQGSLHQQLEALHHAGYVHGDVRDTNVMVEKDGKEGFMLIDFDWAGKIGTACYPMNVNRDPDLGRPAGAYDEQLILVNHDMVMVQHMFDS